MSAPEGLAGMMTYRCWRDRIGDDAAAWLVDANSLEGAAEAYARSIEDDFSPEIESLICVVVNVEAPNDSERVYWVVEVDIDWSPDFRARKAVLRGGAP